MAAGVDTSDFDDLVPQQNQINQTQISPTVQAARDTDAVGILQQEYTKTAALPAYANQQSDLQSIARELGRHGAAAPSVSQQTTPALAVSQPLIGTTNLQQVSPFVDATQGQPSVSGTEAFTRGATQGATLGLGNKAQAALRAAVPFNFSPPDVGESPYNPLSYFHSDRPSGMSFADQYAQYRDEGDQSNQAAMQQHPGAYIAGNMVGALPSTLVAGGGIAKNMVLGGVQGAGQTSNNGWDQAKDIAMGSAISGTLAGIGKAVQTGTNYAVGKYAKQIVQEVNPQLEDPADHIWQGDIPDIVQHIPLTSILGEQANNVWNATKDAAPALLSGAALEHFSPMYPGMGAVAGALLGGGATSLPAAIKTISKAGSTAVQSVVGAAAMKAPTTVRAIAGAPTLVAAPINTRTTPAADTSDFEDLVPKSTSVQLQSVVPDPVPTSTGYFTRRMGSSQ